MDVLALSSGESELAALVRAGTEALGLQALLLVFKITVSLSILQVEPRERPLVNKMLIAASYVASLEVGKHQSRQQPLVHPVLQQNPKC